VLSYRAIKTFYNFKKIAIKYNKFINDETYWRPAMQIFPVISYDIYLI